MNLSIIEYHIHFHWITISIEFQFHIHWEHATLYIPTEEKSEAIVG